MIGKDRQWVANQGWAGVLVLLIFVARVGGGGGQCKIESLQILDLRRLAVMLFSVSSGDETVHVILNILCEILKYSQM